MSGCCPRLCWSDRPLPKMYALACRRVGAVCGSVVVAVAPACLSNPPHQVGAHVVSVAVGECAMRALNQRPDNDPTADLVEVLRIFVQYPLAMRSLSPDPRLIFGVI